MRISGRRICFGLETAYLGFFDSAESFKEGIKTHWNRLSNPIMGFDSKIGYLEDWKPCVSLTISVFSKQRVDNVRKAGEFQHS